MRHEFNVDITLTTEEIISQIDIEELVADLDPGVLARTAADNLDISAMLAPVAIDEVAEYMIDNFESLLDYTEDHQRADLLHALSAYIDEDEGKGAPADRQQYVISRGNVMSGHEFIGPFASAAAAATYCQCHHGSESSTWLILPLVAP